MSFRSMNRDVTHCLNDASPGLPDFIEGNKYMTRIDTSGSNILAMGGENHSGNLRHASIP